MLQMRRVFVNFNAQSLTIGAEFKFVCCCGGTQLGSQTFVFAALAQLL